jgi:hypothetical protein
MLSINTINVINSIHNKTHKEKVIVLFKAIIYFLFEIAPPRD